ncbi:MAG: NUMOD4 domain-containing protein [Pseudolysinimonas sp.]
MSKQRETVSRETWRESKLAPGYQVSDHGRVKSPSGRLIGKANHARGYVRVSISGGRVFMVHQLVSDAFIGPSHGAIVIHRNRIPNDNRAETLKYGTTWLGDDA